MDAFVSSKRRRISGPERAVAPTSKPPPPPPPAHERLADEEESTDFKLAVLASLHPDLNQEILLEALFSADGSVDHASAALTQGRSKSPRKRAAASAIGYQSSISSYRIGVPCTGHPPKKRLTKKGQTLYLYAPEDVEAHTPCSIIHNFLPPREADELLRALVTEAPTYSSLVFQLFEKTVKSPHTFCFYVNDLESAEKQKTEYIYDGRQIDVGCPPITQTYNSDFSAGCSAELT